MRLLIWCLFQTNVRSNPTGTAREIGDLSDYGDVDFDNADIPVQIPLTPDCRLDPVDLLHLRENRIKQSLMNVALATSCMRADAGTCPSDGFLSTATIIAQLDTLKMGSMEKLVLAFCDQEP